MHNQVLYNVSLSINRFELLSKFIIILHRISLNSLYLKRYSVFSNICIFETKCSVIYEHSIPLWKSVVLILSVYCFQKFQVCRFRSISCLVLHICWILVSFFKFLKVMKSYFFEHSLCAVWKGLWIRSSSQAVRQNVAFIASIARWAASCGFSGSLSLSAALFKLQFWKLWNN